jgi:hypothetical protein
VTAHCIRHAKALFAGLHEREYGRLPYMKINFKGILRDAGLLCIGVGVYGLVIREDVYVGLPLAIVGAVSWFFGITERSDE